MKKSTVLTAIIVLLILTLCGCSSNDEGEPVSTDFSTCAGTYTMEDEPTTLVIEEDGSAQIDIYRLTSMEGEATGIYKGIVTIEVTDANGENMKLEFTPDDKTLVVVDSTWEYLPNGETFIFEIKK